MRRARISTVLAWIALAGCASGGGAWRTESESAERLMDRGRFEDAARRYGRCAKLAAAAGQAFGESSCLRSQAVVYFTYPQLDREDEVLALLERSRDVEIESFGLLNHNLAVTSWHLAQVHAVFGNNPEATRSHEVVVAVYESLYGAEDARTEAAMLALEASRRHSGAVESELAHRVRTAALEQDAEPDPSRVSLNDYVTIDHSLTYIQYTVSDTDDVPAYVHVTEEDMPWRVSIGRPHTEPRGGSRDDARTTAIEAMRLWETALHLALPWFELEFVEDDPKAPVQIEWKRRMPGSAIGRGGLRYEIRDGRLHVGGHMEMTVRPSIASTQRLTLPEIRVLVAHEFGHVLGLGHCFDCESAMSYSWETREHLTVTPMDTLTFRALAEIPNGLRRDGRFVNGVTPPDSAKDAAASEATR